MAEGHKPFPDPVCHLFPSYHSLSYPTPGLFVCKIHVSSFLKSGFVTLCGERKSCVACVHSPKARVIEVSLILIFRVYREEHFSFVCFLKWKWHCMKVCLCMIMPWKHPKMNASIVLLQFVLCIIYHLSTGFFICAEYITNSMWMISHLMMWRV